MRSPIYESTFVSCHQFIVALYFLWEFGPDFKEINKHTPSDTSGLIRIICGANLAHTSLKDN